MPVSTCLFYACQIILGLQAMHEKRVVFRDLKPDNMLLDAQGNLRISDFGLACILEERNNWQTTGQAGTRGTAYTPKEREEKQKMLKIFRVYSYVLFSCPTIVLFRLPIS